MQNKKANRPTAAQLYMCVLKWILRRVKHVKTLPHDVVSMRSRSISMQKVDLPIHERFGYLSRKWISRLTVLGRIEGLKAKLRAPTWVLLEDPVEDRL